MLYKVFARFFSHRFARLSVCLCFNKALFAFISLIFLDACFAKLEKSFEELSSSLESHCTYLTFRTLLLFYYLAFSGCRSSLLCFFPVELFLLFCGTEDPSNPRSTRGSYLDLLDSFGLSWCFFFEDAATETSFTFGALICWVCLTWKAVIYCPWFNYPSLK